MRVRRPSTGPAAPRHSRKLLTIFIRSCSGSNRLLTLNFSCPPSDRSIRKGIKSRMPVDVLIVDDSAAIRKILQRVLRQTDIPVGEVLEAGDGIEALRKLNERQVHLI